MISLVVTALATPLIGEAPVTASAKGSRDPQVRPEVAEVVRDVAERAAKEAVAPDAGHGVAAPTAGDAPAPAKQGTRVRIGGPEGTVLTVGETFTCDLPAWMCRRLEQRFAGSAEQLEREVVQLKSRFRQYWGYAMFVAMPVLAALLMLVYRNRRLLFAEHLVFTLHLHAFWFLAMTLTAVLPAAVAGWLVLWIVAYGVLAMRRVYRGRWRFTLLRAAVLAPAYGTVLGVLAGLLGVAIVLT